MNKLWMLVDEFEKEKMLAAFTPPEAPTPYCEHVRYTVELSSAPSAVSWSSYAEDDAELTQGIAVGYTQEADAQALATSPLQTPAPPSVVWDRPDGLHYAWLETQLIQGVLSQNLPLPDLDLDGNRLHLTFRKVPLGQPSAAQFGLLQGASEERVTVWKVTLLAEATGAEEMLIRAALTANQSSGPANVPWTGPPAAEASSNGDDGSESTTPPLAPWWRRTKPTRAGRKTPAKKKEAGREKEKAPRPSGLRKAPTPGAPAPQADPGRVSPANVQQATVNGSQQVLPPEPPHQPRH